MYAGRMLGKYQLVLAVCGRARLDKTSEPYQSAAALIALRNAVVHFKPEWHDEQKQHAKLAKRFQGKFPDCVLMARSTGRSAWFPDRCLGAGCSAWAVETVHRFIAEFCARLGIADRFP